MQRSEAPSGAGAPRRARRRWAAAALRLAALLALVAAAAPARAEPAAAERRERAAVRDTWRRLEAALLARDADAALPLVSAASLETWAALRRVALVGAVDEVEALAPGPRLLVLGVRHAAPAYLHEEGEPAELVARVVRAGVADRRALDAVDLGDVALLGARASALVLAAGLPAGFRAGFVHEDGAWKLDLGATLEGVGALLERIARANRTSESAVIVNLLAVLSGRPVGGAVWQPLAPPARGPAPALPVRRP